MIDNKDHKIRDNPFDNKKEEGYSFYSNKLNKVFDSVEALKDAEQKEADKKAAKEKSSAERKADADRVEIAYKKLREAIRVKGEKIAAAQKGYLKKQAELKKVYEEEVDAINGGVEVYEDEYRAALKAFTKKHGDFHTTFKDGDSTVTLSHSGNSVGDFWDTFFDFLLKL